MSTSCIALRQPGHLAPTVPLSARARLAPQCGQYADPANISAKHFGQLTVASCAWQYRHAASSGAAGPPQLGQ